jgi:hypothetical protein
LPSNFKILAEYFLIPLLVLLISYAISGQFNLRYSAGTDFFIFFLSADLGAIIEYEDLRTRINPLFREDYLAVFVILLTMCILFVIVSGLTQRKLEAWREQEHRRASWRYHPADGGWPIQARFWLEWGSSTAGQSLPAARSRFRAVHSDSISTRPSQPVA